MPPTITKVKCLEFEAPWEDVTGNPDGWGFLHQPGSVHNRQRFAARIHTDEGITGEYITVNPSGFSQVDAFGEYLVGKNPLKRERHWHEIKQRLRPLDRVGHGPFDIALWDIAGKYYDAPVHELLGTYRTKLPTYASTFFADDHGGLDSPEAYADFAEDCLERGYRGYKIHGWIDAENDIQREIDTIHAVGDRVGNQMDLMIDPVCLLDTWADAYKVGKACDAQEFLWYEDPYADGGVSQHGHELLRARLDTPLLQTGEMQRFEQKVDFMASKATDFARASSSLDGGITGVMKTARAAEGLGMDIEIHFTGPAARHCMAAVKNTNYYELGLIHPDVDEAMHELPELFDGDYSDGIDAIDVDGTVTVPDGPGLGVAYNWNYVRDHQLRSKQFD